MATRNQLWIHLPDESLLYSRKPQHSLLVLERLAFLVLTALPQSVHGRGNSKFDHYESFWRHVAPQPDEFTFTSAAHTALRNPVREAWQFNKKWQSPLEYLKEAQTNPLVYPNFFCYPPGSEYSFFRCCLPKLATKDCWGRPLHFGSELASSASKGEGGQSRPEKDGNQHKNKSNRVRKLIKRMIDVESKAHYRAALRSHFMLPSRGDTAKNSSLVEVTNYVHERVLTHLRRRFSRYGKGGEDDDKEVSSTPDDVDVNDLIAYFHQTGRNTKQYLQNGGFQRMRQRRLEVFWDNENLVARLENKFGLNQSDDSELGALDLEISQVEPFQKLRMELMNEKNQVENGSASLVTTPDLCCHHTQVEETILSRWFESLYVLRAKMNLFECLSVLGDIHLRTVIVSFVQRGKTDGSYLNGPSLGLYQKVQHTCDAHYNRDKPVLYDVSRQSFEARKPHHELHIADEKGNLDTASFSEVGVVPPVWKKRFGIVSSCVEATLAYCSLTMSFWHCYANLHHHNTGIFYEVAYDYDLHLKRVTCVRGHRQEMESDETPSAKSARIDDHNSNVRYSPLCRLVFDGLASRWRAKPRTALHAFGQYEWNLAVDAADTSIGPGCFFSNLEELVDGYFPREAEVVVKDPSNAEDSNGGVFLFKSSVWGKLFVDLINDKDNWPTELIGSGCYPEQWAMNEALLELVALETGLPYKSECLRYVFNMPDESGVFGCQFHAHINCFRYHLKRMAGPYGARKTKRVYFLNPRAADVNFRPYGNVAMNGSNLKAVGSPLVWHWVNYVDKRPFILRHMLGIEKAENLAAESVGWEIGASSQFVASRQWCQRVVNASRSCDFGSPGPVCRHLPHQYISQC